MKRFLFLLTLVMVGVVGLGFYFGWFALTAGMIGDRFNITLSVDKDKFQADERTALERVQGEGPPMNGPATPDADAPENQE